MAWCSMTFPLVLANAASSLTWLSPPDARGPPTRELASELGGTGRQAGDQVPRSFSKHKVILVRTLTSKR